jgi:hypothetical protein
MSELDQILLNGDNIMVLVPGEWPEVWMDFSLMLILFCLVVATENFFQFFNLVFKFYKGKIHFKWNVSKIHYMPFFVNLIYHRKKTLFFEIWRKHLFSFISENCNIVTTWALSAVLGSVAKEFL